MYFPYLRGRQFELIALREFASIRGSKNNIIPIIEPVKNSFNSLKLAIEKLAIEGVPFALIVNPKVGEIKKNHDKEKEVIIRNELEGLLKDSMSWIPAFIVTTHYSELNKHIAERGFGSVMIICSDSTDSDNDRFQELIMSEPVKYIVSKEDRTLRRFLQKSGKNLIRLDDSFKAQKQNKDYLAIPEEKFTEEHLYFRDEGYYGFSDYSVLESEFKEGGSLPYAVAIHLTYQKEEKAIWIKHFVSESNTSKANIQGKFAEAAKKAINFLDQQAIHTHASEELRTYYNKGKGTYPGLGMVKKIAIKNHLELINGIL